MMLCINTSKVYGQTIKPNKDFTEFTLDSIALKDYSRLILERKTLNQIFDKYKETIKEKNIENSLLNERINESLKRENDYKNFITTTNDKFDLERDEFKYKIKKVKRQRNIAIVIIATIVTVIVIKKSN